MSADGSAYAALGLEPGADAEAIARAYKRLIKQYHPDREGGDPERAAEINRAYRELRLAGRVKEPLDLEHWEDFDHRGDRRVRTAIALLAAAAMVTLVAGPMIATGEGLSLPAKISGARHRSPPPGPDPIALPVAAGDIDQAVEAAWRISRNGDEMALASASRDCHGQLRREPRIEQLDRCAAFDSAVVQLLDRDPLRDRGPFSELAVTGREMSGATLFSNDYLAIDSRMNAIRLRVELALAPRLHPLPPPEIPSVDDGQR